jgi:hypothetical protein
VVVANRCIEKNTWQNQMQYTRCPSQDSNWELPDYDCRALSVSIMLDFSQNTRSHIPEYLFSVRELLSRTGQWNWLRKFVWSPIREGGRCIGACPSEQRNEQERHTALSRHFLRGTVHSRGLQPGERLTERPEPWTSSDPRAQEDSSPNWGADMPQTGSVISLTGPNRINNC